jgi:hypothetical protein
MLPGPTIIRSCPNCKMAIKQHTIASGNTFGAIYWTDGKEEAPMLPDYPQLVKCPHCSNMLWIDEAKELTRTEHFSSPQGRKEAKTYKKPTLNNYHHFLNTVKVEKEKELYLRMQAWWASNDKYRHNPSENVSLSVEETRNLELLFSMLQTADSSERIIKAEIARELGRYEECQILLDQKFEPDLELVVETIRKLAQKGLHQVAELCYD